MSDPQPLSNRLASAHWALTMAAFVGFGLWFYCQAISPRRQRIEESKRRLTELRQHYDIARRTLGKAKNLEQNAGQALGALSRLLSEGAGDSPMVSFPEQLKEYLTARGLPPAVIRLNTAKEEPGLPGYQWLYWSVGLRIPHTDRSATGLLLAVADLEKQDRFLRIVDFALQPDPEDRTQRVASVNLVILARK